MIKRILWLAPAAIAAWLIWMRLRQRQEELRDTAPLFSPPPMQVPDQSIDEPAAPQTDTSAESFADTSEPPDAPPDEPDETVVAASEPPSAEPAEPDTSEPDLAQPDEPAEAIADASAPPDAPDAPAASAPTPDAQVIDEEIVGYCVRCKTKRAILNPHEETTESGRRAARGSCPVCGANMFTFLASEEGS